MKRRAKKPASRKAKAKAKPETKRSRGRKIYSLRLYVTGQTPRSAMSIHNLREFCKEYLEGRCELEIVDLYQQPELAKEAQVVVAPTLIKRLPPPLKRLVGDLSNRDQVLLGLDLKE